MTTLYGTPGLVDMPTAQSAPDGELSFTIGGFDTQLRNTLSFQITPRLSGSLRYARDGDWSKSFPDVNWDRSFDLRYRILDEGRYLPAVAVGLQDFIGTGRYAAEYLVATKTLGARVTLTGGLGWGRLGSDGGFRNPLAALDAGFETRPQRDVGFGGRVAADQLFRGEAALFGGIAWQLGETLVLSAEYSSDAYRRETAAGTVSRSSPLNFGLSYRPLPGTELGLGVVHGTTLALRATLHLDPAARPVQGGRDAAPIPVAQRPATLSPAAGAARPRAAEVVPAADQAALRATLAQALALEGQRLLALELGGDRARLRFENTRYRATAQALGRITRILTQVMPPQVEIFVLEPVQRGLPLAAVTLQRSDVEALESRSDASARMLIRSGIAAAGTEAGLVPLPRQDGAFAWGLSPYLDISLFDPSAPVRADLGLELAARYVLRPNLVASGAIRKRLIGNRDEIGLVSESDLPPVRRNATFYASEGDPGLAALTLAGYARPGPDLYGRLTAGYLETMFGGVSGELLWKPVAQRLALGIELNYAVQRDVDMRFGFQDYDVVTGHASAYYAFGNGFHGQIDVGRYLAGDWGATLALDREFGNGWRVGAYATLTDVPFEDFGEGSFDKGIRLTVPVDWVLGQPSRALAAARLTSLARDGGARLEVDGRLYEELRGAHRADLERGWGRFWR